MGIHSRKGSSCVSTGSTTISSTIYVTSEGYAGSDKFFQVNAPANLTISNCIDNMGKFLLQNGGTTFTLNVTIDNCELSNMKEGIFRSDSPLTSPIVEFVMLAIFDICIGGWRSYFTFRPDSIFSSRSCQKS